MLRYPEHFTINCNDNTTLNSALSDLLYLDHRFGVNTKKIFSGLEIKFLHFLNFTLSNLNSLHIKTKQKKKQQISSAFRASCTSVSCVAVSSVCCVFMNCPSVWRHAASAFNHSDRPQFDRLLTDSSVVTRVDDVCHVFV